MNVQSNNAQYHVTNVSVQVNSTNCNFLNDFNSELNLVMNRINNFEDNHGIKNEFKANFDPSRFEKRAEPQYQTRPEQQFGPNDAKSDYSNANHISYGNQYNQNPRYLDDYQSHKPPYQSPQNRDVDQYNKHPQSMNANRGHEIQPYSRQPYEMNQKNDLN